MTAYIVSAVIGFVLWLASHPPLTIAVAGVTCHVPLIAVAAVILLACGAAAAAVIWVLHKLACQPYPRTATA